jgi:hypothetical protein
MMLLSYCAGQVMTGHGRIGSNLLDSIERGRLVVPRKLTSFLASDAVPSDHLF